jgi:hypothetical protein
MSSARRRGEAKCLRFAFQQGEEDREGGVEVDALQLGGDGAICRALAPLFVGIGFLAAVVVGGAGSVYGAFVGAFSSRSFLSRCPTSTPRSRI